MASPSGHHIHKDIAEFNELVSQYHAGSNPPLSGFINLLQHSQDTMMQPYCCLMIILLAPEEEEWNTALIMVKYLYEALPSAWDLPGIPENYLGNGICEESLNIDKILDALKTLATHFPEEEVIHKLIDRYLERYVAE